MVYVLCENYATNTDRGHYWSGQNYIFSAFGVDHVSQNYTAYWKAYKTNGSKKTNDIRLFADKVQVRHPVLEASFIIPIDAVVLTFTGGFNIARVSIFAQKCRIQLVERNRVKKLWADTEDCEKANGSGYLESAPRTTCKLDQVIELVILALPEQRITAKAATHFVYHLNYYSRFK